MKSFSYAIRAFSAATALILLAFSATASAGSVHKCPDASGSVIYTQQPCDPGSSAKVIKLKKHRPAAPTRKRKAQYTPGSDPAERQSRNNDSAGSNRKRSSQSRSSKKSASASQAARKRENCKRYRALLEKRIAQGGVEHIVLATGKREIRNDARSRQLISATRDNVRHYCR